jgi:hypothetical protein
MQKIFKIILIACLIIFSIEGISGQIAGRFDRNSCPREQISVHLSQESCLTGEILWFKIYCTSSLYPRTEISCLGLIELVSSENTAIIRKKINLIHGEGSGELEIPDNLPSGVYYLLAYTSWMKNFGEETFFRKEVVIVNPYQPLISEGDSLNPGKLENAWSVAKTDNNDILVQSDKKIYSAREKVIVTIGQGRKSIKNIPGSFSVSVCRKEPSLKYLISQNQQPVGHEDSAGMFFPPDHRGIVLSGNLYDQSGDPVTDAPLVMSMPGPGTDIDSYITGSNGEFNFLLKPGEGEEDIVITLPGVDQKLKLAEPFWNGFRNPPADKIVDFDSASLAYFKERYICFQLRNRFNSKNYMNLTPVKDLPDSSVFYFKPYQTIKPGNYITLDSLGEYFHELVPSVRITTRKGEYDILVMDMQSMTNLKEKPAVFLDGVLFDDYAAVANYPPSDIDRISILPEAYYYKDLSFGGIIDIHTKKSDFNDVKALDNMTRFIYPKAVASEYRFISPDYSISPVSDRTPDFRYLLDWSPYVRPDSSGIADLQFYTGDLKGVFVVEVKGLSDNGDILNAHCEITVE